MKSEHIVDTVGPTFSVASVPRAVWLAGSLLSLVTAGLAGALIMKSGQPTVPADAAKSAPVALVSSAMPASAAVVASVPTNAATSRSNTPIHPAHASTAPAARQAAERTLHPAVHAALCASCGTVESVESIQLKGQGTGLGAVAGGVLGGVVGHQAGGGNGKTAMTILGAIGGGFAGNEVERRTRSETSFDIHVRMDDGSQRVVRQPQGLAVGAHVLVEGSHLRIAPERSSGASRVTQASATTEQRI